MKPGNDNPAEPKLFEIKLNLSREVIRGAQVMARKHLKLPFAAKFTSESLIAFHAVHFALTRPDEFSNFIYSLVHYEDAEGLSPLIHGDQMVENHPSYKKKHLPKKFLPRVV